MFHALWLLCAFGAATLAAAPGRTPWPASIAVLSGLAAGSYWLDPQRLPDAVWVGGLVAAIGGMRLTRADGIVVAAFVAGVLGALWVAMLRAEGLPWSAALVVGAAAPLLPAYLTPTRIRFAPAIVRDEALLVVVTLGVAVAAAPGVLDGWHSAVALNTPNQEDSLKVPAWTLGLMGGSIALGGLYSLWRRG